MNSRGIPHHESTGVHRHLGRRYAERTPSASISIFTVLPTSTPPVSSAWFQVRPKASRSSSALAVKPMRSPPHGSLAPPSKVTSSGTGRVTPLHGELALDGPAALAGGPDGAGAVLEGRERLDVEEVGRAQVPVPGVVTGVDGGGLDRDLDGRVERVLPDHDGALDLAEAALGAGHHDVADAEADVGVGGVDRVGAGGGQLDAVDGAGGGGVAVVVLMGGSWVGAAVVVDTMFACASTLTEDPCVRNHYRYHSLMAAADTSDLLHHPHLTTAGLLVEAHAGLPGGWSGELAAAVRPVRSSGSRC